MFCSGRWCNRCYSRYYRRGGLCRDCCRSNQHRLRSNTLSEVFLRDCRSSRRRSSRRALYADWNSISQMFCRSFVRKAFYPRSWWHNRKVDGHCRRCTLQHGVLMCIPFRRDFLLIGRLFSCGEHHRGSCKLRICRMRMPTRCILRLLLQSWIFSPCDNFCAPGRLLALLAWQHLREFLFQFLHLSRFCRSCRWWLYHRL